MGEDKGAAPPSSKATGSVLTRAMTSPAMTSPSLTTSLNKIPFKLLELKVMAAHDLPPVSKYLHTYVMAWVHPDNKMITPVDHKGNTNPTWNYRMVFGVDDKFLNSESSAVMVEIYNISKLSNRPIGTTCLPVDILLNNTHSEIMKKPLKLQISRPSGDLQGYLIVTINLVSTTIRNLNEEAENSPRSIMIRQISQRLTHSESTKRMTYYEDEEEHEEHDDSTTLSDPDITALSDPESGSTDIETKSLASDVSSAVKDSGMTSPNGEISGPGSSKFDSCSEAGEQNTNEKTNNVVKLREDKVLIKGDEPKVRSRHRRHSDGGGLLSFFTTAIICGSGSMSNKHNKHKNRTLKKKSKSTKKSHGHDMDYPPDQKKLPHDI